MLDTYKKDDFYLAAEVAQIEGLSKVAVIERCKKGFYTGATKAEPTPGNPHGAWLIPKSCIDNPVSIQDVVPLTRQITPVELQKSIEQGVAAAVGQAVNDAVKPLRQEIAELRKENQEIKSEIRVTLRAAMDHNKKHWWKFWD